VVLPKLTLVKQFSTLIKKYARINIAGIVYDASLLMQKDYVILGQIQLK
jgi:predicted O-linked N-acetylglucosamine transferase (SPINDLY family)